MADDGEKRVERQFGVHCALCDVFLPCPDSEDHWGWYRTPAPQAFMAEHRTHGGDNTVGHLMRLVEKE